MTSAALVLLTALAGTAASLWYASQAHVAAGQTGVARAAAERETAWSQTLLYAADMKLASDAITNTDVLRAAELLRRHLPSDPANDHRGFEWYFFQKQLSPPHHVTLEQGAWVNDVELSPDGQWLAIAAAQGAVQVYETAGWTKHVLSHTPCESVNGLTWSPDGKSLAAACGDGRVLIWSSPSGEPINSIAAHPGGANDVVFGRDGQTLYSCGADNLAQAWNVESGHSKQTFSGHRREIERMALSPDGSLLATASTDDSLAVWDATRGVQLHRFESDARMVCVAFSPDGRFVAAGDISGDLYLADPNTGDHARLLKLLDGIEAITFYAGGRLLATADRGGAIQLHVVPSSMGQAEQFISRPPLRWIAHEGRALALAAVSDGQSLISGGRDGTVRVWMPDQEGTRWYPHSVSGQHDCAAGPNSRLYVAGRSVYVWDVEQHRLIDSFAPADSPWLYVSCSADGRYLAAVRRGQLMLFDLDSREVVSEWPLDERLEPHRLAISSGGRRIAFADFTDREFVTVFQSDGSQPRSFPARQCECLAFSPDGHWLAAGHMDDLRLFGVQGKREPRVLAGHSSTLSGVAFSPDGELVATVGHDRLLKVWRVTTGEELHSIVAHRDYVEAVAFTPDGRTIVTAGADSLIKFWHTATGQPLGGFAPRRLVVYDAVLRQNRRGSQTLDRDPAGQAGFVTLGDLPGGGHFSRADDMSADGTVVVGTSDSSLGRQGCRWTQADGMRGLESPEEAWRLRTSADGSVVAACSIHQGRRRMAIWPAPAGSFSLLPLQRDPGDRSAFNALDSSGRLLAGGFCAAGTREWRAILVTHESSQLLPHPDGADHCEAQAIAQGGRIVIGTAWNGVERLAGKGVYGARVVRWQDGELEILAGFDDSKYNWVAWDASDDGSIVVGARWPAGTQGPWLSRALVRPFRWEQGELMVIDASGGVFEAVTSDGRIAVGEGDDGAFVWDQHHGLRRIEGLLRAYGASLQGWWLNSCDAISADGTTMARGGEAPDGRTEAWWARLPSDAFGSD